MTTTRETADHIGEANEKVADHIGDATAMIDYAELATNEKLREELGRSAYDALWERVYQRNPMLRLRTLMEKAA